MLLFDPTRLPALDSHTVLTMMVLDGSNVDENWNKLLKIFIFRRIFGKS